MRIGHFIKSGETGMPQMMLTMAEVQRGGQAPVSWCRFRDRVPIMALADENYQDDGRLREQDRVCVADFLADEDRAQITGRLRCPSPCSPGICLATGRRPCARHLKIHSTTS